jgi:hypothetical protein
LDVSLSPKDLHWQQSREIVGQGAVSISAHLKPAATPSLSLETLSLEAGASLALSAGHIGVTLNPTSLLRLSKVKNETMYIPAIESRFPKGLSWIYHTGLQTWELQAATSTLALPSFSLQGKQWKLGDILTKDLVMTGTPERWVMNAETTATQIRPPVASFKIPPSDWQARYSVNPTSVTVQFNGHTLEHPLHVGGQVRLNLLTGEGSGTMTIKPIRHHDDKAHSVRASNARLKPTHSALAQSRYGGDARNYLSFG